MQTITKLLVIMLCFTILPLGEVVAQDTELRTGVTIVVEGVNLDDLIKVIPFSWLTPEGNLPRYEIRLISESELLQTCNYVPGGTFTRYSVHVTTTFVDLETGQQLGQRVLRGTAPLQPCPSTIQFSSSVSGLPTTASFIQWLQEVTANIPELAHIETEASFCGTPQLIFPDHVREATGASFSPDGEYIATADPNTVYIWNSQTGEPITTLSNGPSTYEHVRFSPDGKMIAVGGYDVDVWNISSGEVLFSLDTGSFTDMRFSPDGQFIVTASYKGGILWDAKSGKYLNQFAWGDAAGIDISDDGTRLVIASSDSGNEPFRVETGSRTFEIVSEPFTGKVDFSPNDRFIAVGTWGAIDIWDIELEQTVLNIRNKRGRFNDIVFSPDGHFLASAQINDDYLLRIWDVETGVQVCQLAGHGNDILDIDFSPDGSHILTASADATVILWDISTLSH